MPDFPIVDAHVHLWDPARFRMAWLDGNPLLDKPYGLAEYDAQTAGLDIAGMVYLQVEVAPPYGLLEARWAIERANEDPRLGAVVAWAPLEYGEQARAYLDALAAIDRRIVGVRRVVQGEPDPDFSIQPRFLQGAQLLAEYDLTCDICIHYQQLPATIRLVERCPEVRFMLDHIAKPNIKDHVRDPWKGHMRALASLDNVSCKISGLVTEADHAAWTPADLKPYVEHILDVFGEDRVAFGGDWPVALQASTYPRWVETLDGLTASLSARAKRKLWGENARRFYRLDTGRAATA